MSERGQSAVLYQRLLEKGVEVPGYQMSAILNAFKVGGLITALLGPQREEDVRKHGDLLIRGVSSDLCSQRAPAPCHSSLMTSRTLSANSRASSPLAIEHKINREGL